MSVYSSRLLLCHHQQIAQHVKIAISDLKLSGNIRQIQLNQPGEPPKIELIRDLQTRLSYARDAQTIEVFLIFDFNSASIPAQNAALKMIEEPANNVVLILVASNFSGVLETIQSRCNIIFCSQKNQDQLLLPKPLAQLLTGKFSWIDIFAYSEKAKDRPQVLTDLQNLIRQTEASLQALKTGGGEERLDQTKHLINLLAASHHAWQEIKANAHIQLSLEAWLGAIVAKIN